ncbi:peptidase M16 [Vibrio galatheae]|uniref:Peptidase M16 n=1 Tax=Vibrio galatheae TaxID=579748 RepID=A0A0F4NLJ5_9VIBR|nr:insulinase family protein [Vibrio galatheae]KJY83997.1 peptidase M16 [Vibrio galatheae]
MSYSLRRLIGAALSVALVFSPALCASALSGLWFEHTDIQMPSNLKVAELTNGVRFIVLPTTRNSNEVSLRVRISQRSQQYADHSALALDAANSTIQQISWSAASTPDHTIFSLDLEHADSKTIEDNLAIILEAIRNGKDRNAFSHNFYTPNNVTVVVTGGINTKSTIKQIRRLFSDWEQPLPSQAQMQPNIALSTYLQPTQTSDTSVSRSTIRALQESQDSKQQRRELLVISLANEVLGQRIQQAVEQHQFQAKVAVKSEILFDQVVLSQIQVSNLSADEKSAAENLVNSEIKRAIASGFSQSEYELAVSQLRQQLDNQTRLSSGHYAAEQADRLVAALNKGRAYTAPSYDLDLVNYHVAHLSQHDLGKAFASSWSNNQG